MQLIIPQESSDCDLWKYVSNAYAKTHEAAR